MKTPIQELLENFKINPTTPQALLYLEKERRAIIKSFNDGYIHYDELLKDAWAHAQATHNDDGELTVQGLSGDDYFQETYNIEDGQAKTE